MTTTGQVKKLVSPLVRQHSDLALVGRDIVIRPVHHILRFVGLDRTSTPDQLTTGWHVNVLFQPARTAIPSWGAKFYSETHGPWFLSNPKTKAVLFEEIENKALPPLRAMDTLEKFLAHVSGHESRHHLFDWPWHKIIVDVALGDRRSRDLRQHDQQMEPEELGAGRGGLGAARRPQETLRVPCR